jgi:16S rRNA (guanine966-N2)-methyltransferase
LRIISGYARGLRLKGPLGKAIRPTSDRAREALFNIIGDHVRHALVLDLFAGTGALGFEALSRGAQHVTFIDNSHEALLLIKKNLQLINKSIKAAQTHLPPAEDPGTYVFRQPASVIMQDLRKGVIVNRETNQPPHCYDLIFLDPPYEKGLSLQMLMFLDKGNFLNKNGILIAEERANVKLHHIFNTLTLVDQRRYGDTGFWIFTHI